MVRPCLVFIATACLLAQEAKADHDDLALRLFLGCIDEIDAFVSRTQTALSLEKAHTTNTILAGNGEINICTSLITSVCNRAIATAETGETRCFSDVGVGLGKVVDRMLNELPTEIHGVGFDPIFYQSSLTTANMPWIAHKDEENPEDDLEIWYGESVRYFHVRSARRLFEKSQLDASK